MKLDELVDWYAALTLENISRVSEFYHPQAHFQDPFNDVRGHDAIAAIFHHMFDHTEHPQFVIKNVDTYGERAWVGWSFNFYLRGKALSIDGVTRMDFGDDGRVIDHRDFWDSAEIFVELPLLGRVVQYLKNRMSSPCKATHTRSQA